MRVGIKPPMARVMSGINKLPRSPLVLPHATVSEILCSFSWPCTNSHFGGFVAAPPVSMEPAMTSQHDGDGEDGFSDKEKTHADGNFPVPHWRRGRVFPTVWSKSTALDCHHRQDTMDGWIIVTVEFWGVLQIT